MTFSKLTWHKKTRGADLSHAEYRVLMILFSYSDEKGRNIRPGKDRIVKESRASEPTVRKALHELIRTGWIVLTEEGGNQHGKGKANVYALSTPVERLGRTDTDDTDGATVDAKGVNGFDEGGNSFSSRDQMVYSPSDQSSDHVSDQEGSRRGLLPIDARSNPAWKPRPDVVERYNESRNFEDLNESEQHEIFDYLETELGGWDGYEHSTAEGMLSSRQRTYAILSKIRNERNSM